MNKVSLYQSMDEIVKIDELVMAVSFDFCHQRQLTFFLTFLYP